MIKLLKDLKTRVDLYLNAPAPGYWSYTSEYRINKDNELTDKYGNVLKTEPFSKVLERRRRRLTGQ